jgi:hypothetical protein
MWSATGDYCALREEFSAATSTSFVTITVSGNPSITHKYYATAADVIQTIVTAVVIAGDTNITLEFSDANMFCDLYTSIPMTTTGGTVPGGNLRVPMDDELTTDTIRLYSVSLSPTTTNTCIGKSIVGVRVYFRGDQADDDDDVMHVWIVSGQSNSIGVNAKVQLCGDASIPVLSQLRQDVVKFWNGKDAMKWTQQVNQKNSNGVSVGPAIAFANHLIDLRVSRRVGLVMCGVGGTPITLWQPCNKGIKCLYQELLLAVTNSLQALTVNGEKYKLAGLVWIQGETDGHKDYPSNADEYGTNLIGLVAGLRTDLPNAVDMPVVMALQDDSTPRNNPGAAEALYQSIDRVRQQQCNVQLSNLIKVDMKGTDMCKNDLIHLSKLGATQLGERMADAYSAFVHVRYKQPSC